MHDLHLENWAIPQTEHLPVVPKLTSEHPQSYQHLLAAAASLRHAPSSLLPSSAAVSAAAAAERGGHGLSWELPSANWTSADELLQAAGLDHPGCHIDQQLLKMPFPVPLHPPAATASFEPQHAAESAQHATPEAAVQTGHSAYPLLPAVPP